MTKGRCKKDQRVLMAMDTSEKSQTKAKVKEKPKVGTSTKGSKSTGTEGVDRSCMKKEKSLGLKDVEKKVLNYIIGQDKQVRQIVTAIYRAMRMKTIKSNVLVIGSSGTGKTETITQIAKKLGIPYTIEDATKYTQEGYCGDDVNDIITNLLENAKGDVKKAQQGLIVIDEIDKKTGQEGYGDRDVSGVEVLKSLLKIIEGTVLKVTLTDDSDEEKTIKFDTKNLIIIFLGAFSGLEKIRDKRLNANPMGFKGYATTKDVQQSRFLKKDLVKYGMPEEFVGRIDTIIEMNKLTKEDLTLILKRSKLSIYRKYQKELKKLGVKLYHKRDLFECIAKESLSLDTGARELSNTVNYMFENIMYEILSDPGKYTKCVLSSEIVHDNTKYELL